MKTNKYYKIKDYNNVHIIIGKEGYGKTYHEKKNIKDKLLKDKEELEKSNNILAELCNYNKDEYPPIYKSTIYLIDYIETLIKWLEVSNETK